MLPGNLKGNHAVVTSVCTDARRIKPQPSGHCCTLRLGELCKCLEFGQEPLLCW